MNFSGISKEDVAKQLSTSSIDGLSRGNVNDRLARFGQNVLIGKKKKSMFKKFIEQFNDFMILILLAAAIISFVVSYLEGNPDLADPIIILMIVVLNALLGILQESKAEKALDALKQLSTPNANVIRDGIIVNISVENLVIGDVVLLSTGDIVPADGRVVESHSLKSLEAQLTGESVSVEKESDILVADNAPIGDKVNMVFSGSSITYGHGKMIVTHTGMNTEVGKIASMIINDDAPDTPLKKRLEETGKILGIGALLICVLIFIIGILKHMNPFFMFMTSVSLAVAAIPEGLPAIVTIMLAIGVQRMAKQNGIIRKLPVVETLGSATVICSDKTGTLTQNKMKVVELSDINGILKNGISITTELIYKIGILCNDSRLSNNVVVGDPTEAAIITSGLAFDFDKNIMDKQYARISELPFDSKRKLMTTICKDEYSCFCATKGAPDFLLEKCKYYYNNGTIELLNANDRIKLTKTNIKMAEKALRVIGVAYKSMSSLPAQVTPKSIERDLIFVGFIGMIDPPRMEVLESVRQCKMAGIKPVMVTGDHIITAKAIGGKIGLFGDNDKAISGAMINELSDDELSDIIGDYTIFARVSPEHKVRIVKAFQRNGEIVAMTGDGVNDAPALKAADIGCAMGISGTEVAKSAADMVLADDNFKTIVEAVREGRGIYTNIKKAVHFLLSSNVGEIITILFAILMGWNTPLLAIHLLWVNLVTDSLPAIALGLDPAEADIMKQKVVRGENNLFSGGLLQRIFIEGIMIGMLALLAYAFGAFYIDGCSISTGRTMAFATLSISQLVHAFNMRSNHSLLRINIFENMYLVGAFVIGLIMQVSVIMITPLSRIFKVSHLSSNQWAIVALLCIMPILIVELEKRFLAKNNYKFDRFDKFVKNE